MKHLHFLVLYKMKVCVLASRTAESWLWCGVVALRSSIDISISNHVSITNMEEVGVMIQQPASICVDFLGAVVLSIYLSSLKCVVMGLVLWVWS